MDAQPTSAPAKRPRAKATVAADTAPKPKRKTLSARRDKSAAPLDLNQMIATAAFYLAAERGFVPGHELDDWLEAERRVRALTVT